MIVQSTSKEKLAPLRSVTLRSKHAPSSIGKNRFSNLPSVKMYKNTYEAAEEYGIGTDIKDSQSQITRNQSKSQMRMTNQSEFVKHVSIPKSLSRGRQTNSL